MHGFLIIDKPLNISSAQVVAKVKKLLGRSNKIGHAGTLDPLATGVLPIAINEATKVVQFLSDANKEYEFDVTWGKQTTTDDAEGQAIFESELRPQKEEILKAMENFVGEIEQTPPQFSAISIDGKRAYDLARKGTEVKIKPRKVIIHRLELLSTLNFQTTTFKMRCSKGTYVRSVARDMGQKLGCFGYVSRLERSAHGCFAKKDAISLEFLAELCNKGAVSGAILPLEKVLDGIPALSLEADELAKVKHGAAIFNRNNISGEIIRLMSAEKLVALASSQNSKLQPLRVFNH